jgi:ligand-binding SRPBCC domain-containing protein
VPTIELVIEIEAPIERCFDLARDIDLHVRSMAGSGEAAIAGVTSGRIGPGEEVTWEGRHFGVRQRFTARITEFDPPRHFQDAMVRGAFRSFLHDHDFEELPDGKTRMRDVVEFRSPLGPLGAIVDRMILTGYLRRLIGERQRAIRSESEKFDAEQFAEAWFAEWGKDPPISGWATRLLVGRIDEDAERAWELIRILVEGAPDHAALEWVGAGPLEDLLCEAGPRFVDRVEAQAARDARFRVALSDVWGRNRMDPDVYDRVCRAAPADRPVVDRG